MDWGGHHNGGCFTNEIRKVRINKPQYIWLSADGSQAEARVVAWAGPVPSLRSWFSNREDVHLNVARQIARIVQENKLVLPRRLFMSKPWNEYTKEDKSERQVAKTTVHANNYGLGKIHYSTLTGLPVKFAQILQEIYFSLFPEIKTGYQAWIDSLIRESRTIVTPFGRRRVFYDVIGPELSRAAYAFYPQSTVGDWLTNMITRLCECFSEPSGLLTPQRIRLCGLGVQLNVHDQVLIAVPNQEEDILYAARQAKSIGEEPINIRGSDMVIPVDIKTGPNWGELKDFIIEI